MNIVNRETLLYPVGLNGNFVRPTFSFDFPSLAIETLREPNRNTTRHILSCLRQVMHQQWVSRHGIVT
jgi:hypothetical protein